MQVSSGAEMRGVGRTRPAEKAKAKVMEEKKNTEEKENLEANKYDRMRSKMRRMDWVQVAPTMGSGGSYPEAMADPEEECGSARKKQHSEARVKKS